MARFCKACGTPLVDETARFCTKCGAAFAAPPNSSADTASLSVSGSEGSRGNDKTLPFSGPNSKAAVAVPPKFLSRLFLSVSGRKSRTTALLTTGTLTILIVGGGIWQGNKGKDLVTEDGKKYFGWRKLKDGTEKAKRIEFADGMKYISEIILPDGTEKVARVEFADGEKKFDVIGLPDGSEKAARVEYPNGVKNYDVTWLPNGTKKIGRIEQPDGKKLFDVTRLRDGSEKAGRVEMPDGNKQFDVTLSAATGVVLLDTDPAWVALQKKANGDSESVLREFSPEWNQIQAEIDKEVATINDPSLRADERRRVSERLLPREKAYELSDEARKKLDKLQADYLSAHKDDYRVIASFSNGENPAYCHASECRYPNPVMQIQPQVEGDGVLFYKGPQGVIKDINSDTAEKWSITEEIKVQTLIRLTVREMDSILTKFRDLKKQEISQETANFAPYSSMVAAATGSSAMEDAGYVRATPEQVKATDASLKKGDLEKAELGVWDRGIVLAAQVDVGKDKYQTFLREGSHIYLVDKDSGTILTEIPKVAFCFSVEQATSQGIHGDYSDEHKSLHTCSLDPREQ
jgi:zinc-ribbon domain